MSFQQQFTIMRRPRALVRVALVLMGVLSLTVLSGQITPPAKAHWNGLHYQQGVYLDNGWMCRGWSNGSYRCTQHWHWANGRLVSDNPAWVPNDGGYVASYSAPARTYSAPAPQPAWRPSTVSYGAPSAWAPTGRGAYAMSDFWGDPYSRFFGACTWYTWYRRQDQPLMQLGNAAAWAWNAPARGLPTGTQPRVGATAVFQGGVQGASWLGHTAHVEAVYGNGVFLVSEMSFYYNGGGWGRVSYRYVHTGPGVSFIY